MKEENRRERSLPLWRLAFVLWGLTHGNRLRLAAMTACSVVLAAAAASEPIAIAHIFDSIVHGVKFRWSDRWLWTGFVLGLAWAGSARLRDWFAATMMERISEALINQLADRDQTAARAHEREGLQLTMGSGVEAVSRCLASVLPGMLSDVVAVVAGTLTGFLLDWHIALVVLVALVPMSLLSTRLVRRLGDTGRAHTEQAKLLKAEMDQFFTPEGRSVVASMRARSIVLSRVAERANKMRPVERRRFIAMNCFPETKAFGSTLTYGTIVMVWQSHVIAVGAAVGFLRLVTQVVQQMVSLMLWFAGVASLVADVQLVLDVLELPLERQGGEPVDRVERGLLELRDVHAVYPKKSKKSEKSVLNGISLTLPPGQIVAVVGESGEGKTTLLRLLTDYEGLEIVRGGVWLDGIPLRGMSLDALREVLVCLTDTYVFNDSIEKNLLLPAGAKRELPAWAFKLAALDQKLVTSAADLNTEIRSNTISGGERQRVSMARTLSRLELGAARWLLLDESTSALDAQTEQKVITAVLAEVRDRGLGCLLVTHSVPVPPEADRVVVIGGGKILAEGPPAELAADETSPYYKLLRAARGE